ncbi:hypothetical protein [Streptomyces sp. NPDC057623]|uniref:hypothetical protein n=1 Tax=Streptomyces sp. NPDC057623 TaxID=3346187 RepID=UPI0036BF3E64
MQLVHTPAGDVITVMEVPEILILEVALSRHALANPDSRISLRMLAEVSRVNEEREARIEDAAEARR